jgi:hypothetical protein
MTENAGVNRRDFNRLAMSALGGALAGSIAGCDSSPPATPKTPATGTSPTGSPKGDTPQTSDAADTDLAESVAAVGVEKHVCRGLNACKNQGASKENDCAGQGTCATVDHHTCGGQNACKGQGGCGKSAVENECAGKGGCHVPLMDDVWDKARKIFEAKMKKAGTEFSAAPAKANG